MTDWWEQAYKGGPMVAVPGFPRPLYPPDASKHGKTPSVDGPDVEAYKRTVSRAGRWPWQPFDRDYSNGFAHGTSGDVGETGIAGVQRQQRIDDTGWIGEKTFNTLRSIRIPVELPHGGDMAMDVTAANLIAQAYGLYHGHEPPATPPQQPGQSTRERALAAAIGEIGYVESGNNATKYGDWYGMDHQPWCAMFVTWCFETEGGGSPSFARGSNYAYCPYIVGDARNQRNGLSVTSSPVPGDVVVYDWSYDGEHDHVGIFERWQGETSFDAIEGNTSPSNYSNGGQVMRCRRSTSSQGTVFVRVA
jgi:hypothetical protein